MPSIDQVVARMEIRGERGRAASVRLQAGEELAVFADSRNAHFSEPGVTGMNLSRTSELAHALI
jgi:hypothetical protein